MFKLSNKRTASQWLSGKARPERGAAYQVVVPSGNWSPWFGEYENQKWGEWDSESCWKLSQVNCLEDELKQSKEGGDMPQAQQDFLTAAGYIDQDGDVSISEQYGEILGGLGIQGGDAPFAWQIDQKWGCIPRAMLNYSVAQAAACATDAAFVADYFNEAKVTPAMKALGKKFLQYFSMDYQRIGDLGATPPMAVLQAALQQAPCSVGIPVPYIGGVCMWNMPDVTYQGGTVAQHEVELYGIDATSPFPYLVFDQYLPNLKALSANFLLVGVIQGTVACIPQGTAAVPANPVPQSTYWDEFWAGVEDWYNGVFDSKVQIGKA